MKQLELQLQKRLLIVEYERNEDLIEDFEHYQKENVGLSPEKKEIKIKVFCKGSEFTEDIAKEYLGLLFSVREFSTGDYGDLGNLRGVIQGISKEDAKSKWQKDHNVTEYDICFYDFSQISTLESFISAIEAKGFYWVKNPVKKPNLLNYHIDEEGSLLYNEALIKWQEAQAKTFNPDKCIIYEIL